MIMQLKREIKNTIFFKNCDKILSNWESIKTIKILM